MALEETLSLETGSALRTIDDVGKALDQVAKSFEVSLQQAIDTVDRPIVTEINADVSDASAALNRLDDDTINVDVNADTTNVTGEVTGSVEAADTAVVITADATDVTGSINAAVDAADTAVDLPAPPSQGLDAATGAADNLGVSLGGVRSTLAAIGGLAATVGLTSVLRDAVDAASDLDESQSKANQVFGESVGIITEFGETSAESVGLATKDATEFAATFGNLFTALGLTQDAASELSPEVVQLGADLASFNNLEVDVTLEKLRSGLVGEIEPLRSLGISFNAAQVEAKALELNLQDANGEISESAKVQARYALILEQTTAAQGDFARTSDGLANQQRILAAKFQDTLTELGKPLISPALELLQQSAPIIEDLVAVLGDVGAIALESITPLVEAAGPLVDIWRENTQEVLTRLQPAIEELGQSFANLAVAATPAVEELTDALVDAAPAVEALTKFTADLVNTMALFTTLSDDVSGSFEFFLSNLSPQLGSVFSTIDVGNKIFGDGSDEVGNYAGGLDEVLDATIRAQGAARGLTTEQIDSVIATRTAYDGTVDYAGVLRQFSIDAGLAELAAEDLAAAEEAAATASEVSASQFVALAEAVRDGTITSEDYQAVADELGITLDGVEGFANSVTDALESLADTAIEKLPTVSSAINEIDDELTTTPDEIINALAEREEAIANFQRNVAVLIAFGFDDIAQLAIERGPEFTNDLVYALQVGRPTLASELETSLETFGTQFDNTSTFLEDEAIPQLVSSTELAAGAVTDTWGTELEAIPGATQTGVDGAAEVLDGAAEPLAEDSDRVARALTGGFEGALGLDSATEAGGADAQAEMDALGLPTSGLVIAAGDSGEIVGNSFAIGLGNAISDAAADGGYLNTQVRSAVQALESAAAEEALEFPNIGVTPSVFGGSSTSGAAAISFSPGSVVINVNAPGGDAESIAFTTAKAVGKALPSAVTAAMLAAEVGAS